MPTNFNAIYENGAFRPVGDVPLPLVDGAIVRLTVEATSQDSKQNILELGAQVYAGLSEADIAEIEKIATDRAHFFSP